jgi:hypothetical protein
VLSIEHANAAIDGRIKLVQMRGAFRTASPEGSAQAEGPVPPRGAWDRPRCRGGCRSGSADADHRPVGVRVTPLSDIAGGDGCLELLRASQVDHDPKIADAAAAAFRTIPRQYLHATNGGQWILEYSQSSLLTLNAQMQSLILISEYARTTGDPEAKSVAAEMLTATRAALPSLDLGCWSRYSIGGNRATTDYHGYHISLLRRLATMMGDATFSEIASRWSKGHRGTC